MIVFEPEEQQGPAPGAAVAGQAPRAPEARRAAPAADPVRRLALAQGASYVITGLWPFVGPRTFQAVTGPKTDFWLVRTVGVLVAVIGAVVATAVMRRRVEPETVALAAGSAAGLAAIDIVYAARGRISKVYLLDALAEIALVGGWLGLSAAKRATQSPSPDERQ